MPATAVELHAAALAALGVPVRLSILRLVVQGDPAGTPVGDIQARLDVPWSTLSHHLDRLAGAGLLQSQRDGRFILYRADYGALRRLTDYLWEDCCKGGGADCCPKPTATSSPRKRKASTCTSSNRTSR